MCNRRSKLTMEKVVRDGKVAVLISPGWGSGWSTGCLPPEAAFHPELVKLVEENRHSEITKELCERLFSKHVCYLGGLDSLEICWVPIGTEFYIEEYDGNESIITKGDRNWHSI